VRPAADSGQRASPALVDVGAIGSAYDPAVAAGCFSELVALLRDRATRITLTTAQGSGLDCEIGAPSLRAQRIGDRLDDAVAARTSCAASPGADRELS
jgi:hypothetical protein